MGLGESFLSQVTVTNVTLGLVAYVVLKFVYQIVYYRFFHPLSVFPGPFWGSVTRLWIAWHNLRETELPTVYALTKQYGPVVRITPTLLLVSDPTKLPEIYHRNADKTGHYITGTFGETESLFNMRSHKTHAVFRKHVAGPYSFSNVRKMEPLIDVRIQDWINKLEDKFAQTGKGFDFAWWAVYMAYDIISEIGFGAPFGFVEQAKDVGGLIRGFHDGLPAFGFLARLHPFTSWVKTTFLKKYLVATPQDDSGIGILMRFRDRLIDQRFRELEANKDIGRIDLLQTFIEARTEDGSPLEIEYLKAEVLLVLLAGADTTGTVFQALIHFLLTHPAAYRRMMKEIDSVSAQGLLSDPVPQYDEITAYLPYYVACVRETLRLNPPAPNIFPRYVSEPGLDLYGRFAPAGTEVSGNPWIMQRNPAMYGEDAEEFRPERWLDADKAKVYNKYLFTFGYGARMCLGREIAMMELYKGPLQFFRRFNITPMIDKPAARFVIKGVLGSTGICG
ncbi:cytochrome P450 [Aspergillus clavatus NRRL 1]|uniref:Cytochrome P450 monooxygenase, putative n=1 Tax=Aspergillus clavatus (strain ATCC 1007 / CBS 513.65 / DSM 816 / NCTC 3887 / NRRL 1 / QM 1276 / 107) TaxID=344612 RepID=A1CDZ9_ASPCL|nr:cytochrome P450 monooxygenase, putative [Aspergillus clavatus NRRL 1]EAW12076.1 cytochrome P450 monooxygenase, putative [Aspergillus clavatus NRRL 1]